MRGSYGRAADAVSSAGAPAPADTRPAGHWCAAYGCPMPGAISESTTGGGTWLCRRHFGARPDDWQEITTQVRRDLRPGATTEVVTSQWVMQARTEVRRRAPDAPSPLPMRRAVNGDAEAAEERAAIIGEGAEQWS